MEKNRLEAFGDGVPAIPLAFMSSWIASGLYVFVAIMWFIPDRRIERVLANTGKE